MGEGWGVRDGGGGVMRAWGRSETSGKNWRTERSQGRARPTFLAS